MAVVGPQRVRGDVGDDHRLFAVGGCSARTRRRSYGAAIDGIPVPWRQAGRRTVPQPLTVGIQEQNRTQAPTGHLLDQSARGIEDRGERIAPGHHFEVPVRLGEPGLRQLAVLDVNGRSIPLDQAPLLVMKRRGAKQEPARLAVVPPQPGFCLPRLTGGERGPPDCQQVLPVLGPDGGLPAPALSRLETEAGVFPPELAHEIEGAVGESGPDEATTGIDRLRRLDRNGTIRLLGKEADGIARHIVLRRKRVPRRVTVAAARSLRQFLAVGERAELSDNYWKGRCGREA